MAIELEVDPNRRRRAELAPDVTVAAPLAQWADARVPVWLVRISIAVLGGLAAGFGGSLVIVYRGGFSYGGGFGWEIGWSTVVSVAVALAVCFIERLRRSTAARWTVAIGIILTTAFITQDGILSLLIAIGGSLVIIALLVPLQLGVRLAWIQVRPVAAKMLTRFASIALLVAIALAIQVGDAGPAVAQADERRPCVDPAILLQVDGNTIDLTNPVGSDPQPLDYELDLEAGSEFVLTASTQGDRRVVATVELVRTTPFDNVRGTNQLIWHTEVEGTSEPQSLTISQARDGDLDVIKVEVGDSSVPVDMFAGVGTFHVTLVDRTIADPEEATCTAEVNLRIVGSGWETPFGRWATIAVILGSAGCASVALVRPEAALPAGQCTDAAILENGVPLTPDQSGYATLEPGKEYEFKLRVNFLELKEDDKLAKLKPRDVVRLGEIPGLITAEPKLTFSGGGGVAVTPFHFKDQTTADAITVQVGSQQFPVKIRMADQASADDPSEANNAEVPA